MIVLPEIRSLERGVTDIRLELEVPASLTYFQGHFTGCPLLPGVVQIGWAIELGRAHVPFEGTFRALSAVKFTRVIVPDVIVALTLEYARDKRQLTFAFVHEGRPCSSGTALFDA